MKLWTGHVLDVLPTLPERSVQSCVTSPPYYGLRRYAGEQDTVWNGKDGCEHQWGEEIITANSGGGWNDPETRHLYPPFRLKDPAKERPKEVSQGSFCARCGAWKGALGLEPTPALYIKHLMAILDALWRVLRDDGVLWWNLGTSFINKEIPSDKWVLRDDLSDEEREYVLSEILKTVPFVRPTDAQTKQRMPEVLHEEENAPRKLSKEGM